MSMHKIPLTPIEEAGLRAHGLDIGTPSQLSDAFRQGVRYASAQLPSQEAKAAPAETDKGEAFCDGHCTWLDHQHGCLRAELVEVIDQRNGECVRLQGELAELKAKMEGVVLVPIELIEHVKHARKLLGGNGAPEWQREKLRQKLTDLLANAMLAPPQRPAIVAALQAECKGLEDEVNKLERNLAAAPSKEAV